MVKFEGKYQHQRSEKFDELLKAIGVPLIPRKLVGTSNPLVEVIKNGDTWNIKMHTLLRTIEYTFTAGETVNTETMGGVAKNIFTFEDNKIKQTQTAPKYTLEVVREFSDESLTMIQTHVETGIVSHRYFKRIE